MTGPSSAPNDSIAELIGILGVEETRGLVHTYLKEYDSLIRIMVAGSREEQHRATHSLKSSSHCIGLFSLSSYLKALEAKLSQPLGTVTKDDITGVIAEFQRTIKPLKDFAEGK